MSMERGKTTSFSFRKWTLVRFDTIACRPSSGDCRRPQLPDLNAVVLSFDPKPSSSKVDR